MNAAVTLDEGFVECIGSAALVTSWEVGNVADLPLATLCRFGGSVLGNDAVILARELGTLGVPRRCQLLNPTEADMLEAKAVLGANGVVGIDQEPGDCTRSLCLEDSDGIRHWLFSRIPAPKGELNPFRGDFVYIDYYHEFREFLQGRLLNIRANSSQVFFNLSALSSASDVPRLPCEPTAVQASAPSTFGVEAASNLAIQIAAITGARCAFVTMAARGAVLAKENQVWSCVPSRPKAVSILGAGALFSSMVVLGLLRDLDGEELLHSAVNMTTERLDEI